jgi:hypothetical protein
MTSNASGFDFDVGDLPFGLLGVHRLRVVREDYPVRSDGSYRAEGRERLPSSPDVRG